MPTNNPVIGPQPGHIPPVQYPPPGVPQRPPADPAQERLGVMYVLETPDDRGIEPHRAAIEAAIREGMGLLQARQPAFAAADRPNWKAGRKASKSALSPKRPVRGQSRVDAGARKKFERDKKAAERAAILRALAAARLHPRTLHVEALRRVLPGTLPFADTRALKIEPLFSLPAGVDPGIVAQSRMYGLHRFFTVELPMDHIKLEAVLGDQKRARLFDIKALLRAKTELASVAVDLPVDGLSGSGTTRPSTAESAGWHLEAIGIIQNDARAIAANITGAGVRIAHPDTGWTHHPEILGQLDLEHQFNVFNFALSAEEPLDDAWKTGQIGTISVHHGTGTGSLIVSTDSASIGTDDVLGVAPGARLIPIRCASAVLLLSGVSLAVAILRAVIAGADIISMSLGGLGGKHLQMVLKLAVARNIIPVAAAGNWFPLVVCPALYAETIGVAAIDGARQPMSERNAKYITASGCAVDIAAPGASIHRAYWSDEAPRTAERAASDGSSYATAITAGAAALWLQRHGKPQLVSKLRAGETLLDVFRAHLTRSARNSELWDTHRMGAGVLNVPGLLDPAILAAYRAEPWLPTPLNAALLALPMTWADALIKMLCPLFGTGAVLKFIEQTFTRGLAAIEELGEELVAFLRESAEVATALVEAARAHVMRFIDSAIARLEALLATTAAAAQAALREAIRQLQAARDRIEAAADEWAESVEDVVRAVLSDVGDRVDEVKEQLKSIAAEAKDKALDLVDAIGDVAGDAINTVSGGMLKGLSKFAGLFD